MLNKILSIFALLQFTSIHSQLVSNISDSVLQKIQNEILQKIWEHEEFLWKQTPAELNIQFSPLSAKICIDIAQLKYSHDAADAISREQASDKRTWERNYALADILDALQKSTNVKLKVNNAAFNNEKNTSENFSKEAQTHYHSELYKVSFDAKDNELVLATINDWISKNTKGRGQKLENLPTSGKIVAQVTTLSFTGCWDKSKSANPAKSLNFKSASGEIKVDAFNAKERIAYLNYSKDKYEAIRIPFKNGEFALIVLLPYPDQPLESFKKLRRSQYRQLFENITSANETNVDYTIPILNSPMISFNENGTSVNGDDFIACDSSSPNQQRTTTDYKRFYVDRPFGMFIYDEKTKIILVHTFVKNPTSTSANLTRLETKDVSVVMHSANFYESIFV